MTQYQNNNLTVNGRFKCVVLPSQSVIIAEKKRSKAKRMIQMMGMFNSSWVLKTISNSSLASYYFCYYNRVIWFALQSIECCGPMNRWWCESNALMLIEITGWLSYTVYHRYTHTFHVCEIQNKNIENSNEVKQSELVKEDNEQQKNCARRTRIYLVMQCIQFQFHL